jgi:O-antigen/teichoic acid export membrane protein
VRTAEGAVAADSPTPSTDGRLLRTGSARGRASWSLADQALSSLTNFGLALLVARSTSGRQFGAFELAYSLYLFVVGCSRAVGAEPLLVRHSDTTVRRVREATAASTGTALVVGLVAGLACIAGSPLVDDPTSGAVAALGLALPGLLVQDAWRYAFFAAGCPGKAAANDAVWALCQVALLASLFVAGDPPVGHLVLAWGVSGGVGAVLGLVQSRVLPRPAAVVDWLRRHRDLAPRFLGEFSVGLGASQLSIWLVGVVGGLQVVGALRAATLVLGPFRILLTAAPAAAIPELVRLRNRSSSGFLRALVVTSLALGGLVGAWGLLALLLPGDVGRSVLGRNWEPARPLLPLVALGWSALGLGTGAMIGLRVLADARRSFRARLLIVPVLLLVPVGFVVGGDGDATDAAVGLAVVSCWSAVVWWVQLRRSLRSAEPRPVSLDARAPSVDPLLTGPVD